MDKKLTTVLNLLRGAHELVNSSQSKYTDMIYLQQYINHAHSIMTEYAKHTEKHSDKK